MNIKRLQLFQVYVMKGQVKKRFHMQVNEGNRFKIMGKDACPEFCLSLEDALHDAILENHSRSLTPAI